MSGTEVEVAFLPMCDFCDVRSTPAEYDFRTLFGSWANGCEEHYLAYRMHKELGVGKGQRLVLKKE